MGFRNINKQIKKGISHRKFSSITRICLIITLLCLILLNQKSSTKNDNLLKSESDKLSVNRVDYELDSFTVDISQNYPKIAFVKPTFTAAAYSGFYSCFSTARVDARGCFIRPESNSWSTSSSGVEYINKMINEGYPSEKISFIKDSDVHKGLIFDELGKPLYSSLLFFHNEYVSLQEYYNIVKYIQAGGNAIVLNGNAFFAEVDYDEATNNVILVSGHGWTFDGYNQSGSGNYRGRFRDDQNSFEHWRWFGSVYTNFNSGLMQGAKVNTTTSNPHPIALELANQGINMIAPNINSHEENSLITANAHIIADWQTTFAQTYRGIKIYEIFPEGPFGGSLIHFGFFGSGVLPNHSTARAAVLAALRHQAGYLTTPWIKYPMNDAVLNKDIVLQYTKGWNTEIWIDGLYYPNLDAGSNIDFLPEGEHNLSIKFGVNQVQLEKSITFEIDRTVPEIIYNGESEFSLPSNFPVTPLNININDKNPEFLWVALYDGGPAYNVFKPRQEFSGINFTSNFNNGKWMVVEAMDSAGNWNKEQIVFNSTNPNPVSRKLMPTLEKINETKLMVSIERPEPDAHATLQISEDFGKTWLNIEFNETNVLTDEVVAYYEKNSSFLWYRVKIESPVEFSYVRNVRSYQWDNTIYSIINSSLKSSIVSSTPQSIMLKKSQYQTVDIELLWTNKAGNIIYSDNLGESINLIENITFTVPSITSGYYQLLIKISSFGLNISLPFDIYIDHSPPFYGSNYYELYLKPISLSSSNFSLIDNQPFNILVFENLSSTIILSIRSSNLGQINFTTGVLVDFLILIFDDTGHILFILEIANVNSDHPPSILGESSYNLPLSSIDNFTVYWQILDLNNGTYKMYINDLLYQYGSYVGHLELNLSLTNLGVGSYEIIIEVTNENNLISNFMTLITIFDDSPIPTNTNSIPSSSAPQSSSSNISSSQSLTTTESNSKSKSDFYLLMVPASIVICTYLRRKIISV